MFIILFFIIVISLLIISIIFGTIYFIYKQISKQMKDADKLDQAKQNFIDNNNIKNTINENLNINNRTCVNGKKINNECCANHNIYLDNGTEKCCSNININVDNKSYCIDENTFNNQTLCKEYDIENICSNFYYCSDKNTKPYKNGDDYICCSTENYIIDQENKEHCLPNSHLNSNFIIKYGSQENKYYYCPKGNLYKSSSSNMPNCCNDENFTYFKDQNNEQQCIYNTIFNNDKYVQKKDNNTYLYCDPELSEISNGKCIENIKFVVSD